MTCCSDVRQNRNLIRRAEAEGVQVEAYEHPSDGMVYDFITAYAAFANERHMSALDVGVIRVCTHREMHSFSLPARGTVLPIISTYT